MTGSSVASLHGGELGSGEVVTGSSVASLHGGELGSVGVDRLLCGVDPRNLLWPNDYAPVDHLDRVGQESFEPYLGLYPQSLLALKILHLSTTSTAQTMCLSSRLLSGVNPLHIVAQAQAVVDHLDWVRFVRGPLWPRSAVCRRAHAQAFVDHLDHVRSEPAPPWRVLAEALTRCGTLPFVHVGDVDALHLKSVIGGLVVSSLARPTEATTLDCVGDKARADRQDPAEPSGGDQQAQRPGEHRGGPISSDDQFGANEVRRIRTLLGLQLNEFVLDLLDQQLGVVDRRSFWPSTLRRRRRSVLDRSRGWPRSCTYLGDLWTSVRS